MRLVACFLPHKLGASATRRCYKDTISSMKQSLEAWEGRVKTYLQKNGGSALRSHLGGAVQLPPALGRNYAAALRKCGFQVVGNTVRCKEDEWRSPGKTLSSLMGKRRPVQRPLEEEDDERPARRKQRIEPTRARRKQRIEPTPNPSPLNWSIDPRPGSANEEARQYERGFRFGTPTSDAGPRDGAPSRLPSHFNWSRFEHNWEALAPRSAGQQHYVNLLRDESISVVVGLGKAGTGKTLLAVYHGLEQLRAGRVRKLILGRPAVAAGEELGLPPGSLTLTCLGA